MRVQDAPRPRRWAPASQQAAAAASVLRPACCDAIAMQTMQHPIDGTGNSVRPGGTGIWEPGRPNHHPRPSTPRPPHAPQPNHARTPTTPKSSTRNPTTRQPPKSLTTKALIHTAWHSFLRCLIPECRAIQVWEDRGSWGGSDAVVRTAERCRCSLVIAPPRRSLVSLVALAGPAQSVGYLRCGTRLYSRQERSWYFVIRIQFMKQPPICVVDEMGRSLAARTVANSPKVLLRRTWISGLAGSGES